MCIYYIRSYVVFKVRQSEKPMCLDLCRSLVGGDVDAQTCLDMASQASSGRPRLQRQAALKCAAPNGAERPAIIACKRKCACYSALARSMFCSNVVYLPI